MSKEMRRLKWKLFNIILSILFFIAGIILLWPIEARYFLAILFFCHTNMLYTKFMCD